MRRTKRTSKTRRLNETRNETPHETNKNNRKAMRRPDRKDETTHRTHRRDEERDDIEGTSKSVVDKEHQAHERKKNIKSPHLSPDPLTACSL